jgi:hypothetical protein
MINNRKKSTPYNPRDKPTFSSHFAKASRRGFLYCRTCKREQLGSTVISFSPHFFRPANWLKTHESCLEMNRTDENCQFEYV